jgi:hypothetical protein
MIDLAAGHHAAHQGQRFRGHRKIGEAGGKAGEAQDAHRVFGKGRADMAQDFGLQIALTVEGVDQCAVGCPAMALMVRSRRARSSSSVTSGAAWKAKP